MKNEYRRQRRRDRAPSPGRVTARDVAGLAGVSISAVSRVFTEGASVSAATRKKVIDATRSLGYQPNLLARSLMTKRTELIGLISNNFDNPAYMEIFDLFTRRLQQRGLRPLLANLSDGLPPDGALSVLMQYSVDGVIVSSSPLHRQFAEACADARLPVVQAFGRPGGKSPINVVGADNVQGGRVAGDLLCGRGYRRIAFLGGPRDATSTEDRLEGFRAGSWRTGFSLSPRSTAFLLLRCRQCAHARASGSRRHRRSLLWRRYSCDGRDRRLRATGVSFPGISASSASTICRWLLGPATI